MALSVSMQRNIRQYGWNGIFALANDDSGYMAISPFISAENIKWTYSLCTQWYNWTMSKPWTMCVYSAYQWHIVAFAPCTCSFLLWIRINVSKIINEMWTELTQIIIISIVSFNDVSSFTSSSSSFSYVNNVTNFKFTSFFVINWSCFVSFWWVSHWTVHFMSWSYVISIAYRVFMADPN